MYTSAVCHAVFQTGGRQSPLPPSLCARRACMHVGGAGAAQGLQARDACARARAWAPRGAAGGTPAGRLPTPRPCPPRGRRAEQLLAACPPIRALNLFAACVCGWGEGAAEGWRAEGAGGLRPVLDDPRANVRVRLPPGNRRSLLAEERFKLSSMPTSPRPTTEAGFTHVGYGRCLDAEGRSPAAGAPSAVGTNAQCAANCTADTACVGYMSTEPSAGGCNLVVPSRGAGGEAGEGGL